MNRLMESFDGYNTGAMLLTAKWNGVGTNTIATAAKRTGANGCQIITTNNGSLTRIFDAQQKWVFGTAMRYTGGPNTSCSFWRALDSTTLQMDTSIDGSFHYILRRNGTTVATGTFVNSADSVFRYIEVKYIIANAGGTAELRINGVVDATFTGDTQNTANATADRCDIWADVGSGGFNCEIDDVYINDGQGSVNNDYSGDQAVYYLRCNTAGDNAEWTPSASTNVSNIDDVFPDDDTTYNSTDVENELDLFNVEDLPLASGVIAAICIHIRARKETAGTANIQRAHKRAGTTSLGSSFNPSTSYESQYETLELDPVSAAAFTIANVNDMQLGYKAVA